MPDLDASIVSTLLGIIEGRKWADALLPEYAGELDLVY
jgi:hypothetical protein